MFSMKAGDTKRLYVTIKDKDGQAIDLTEATLRWQASRGTLEQFSRTPILQKTIGNGIEPVALFDGEFVVELAPEDTTALNGSYYFEVEVTDAFGNVATPIYDTFTVAKDLIK